MCENQVDRMCGGISTFVRCFEWIKKSNRQTRMMSVCQMFVDWRKEEGRRSAGNAQLTNRFNSLRPTSKDKKMRVWHRFPVEKGNFKFDCSNWAIFDVMRSGVRSISLPACFANGSNCSWNSESDNRRIYYWQKQLGTVVNQVRNQLTM